MIPCVLHPIWNYFDVLNLSIVEPRRGPSRHHSQQLVRDHLRYSQRTIYAEDSVIDSCKKTVFSSFFHTFPHSYRIRTMIFDVKNIGSTPNSLICAYTKLRARQWKVHTGNTMAILLLHSCWNQTPKARYCRYLLHSEGNRGQDFRLESTWRKRSAVEHWTIELWDERVKVVWNKLIFTYFH